MKVGRGRRRWMVGAVAALIFAGALAGTVNAQATVQAEAGTEAQTQSSTQDALLVVAHGAPSGEWNQRVVKLVEKIAWPGPVAVAFLMTRQPEEELGAVVARLDAQAKRIVMVPLMVSSFGEHYDELRYYVGQLKEKPEHAHGERFATKAEILLTPAMDDHPLVSEILLGEVAEKMREAPVGSVVLVGHGPTSEEYNAKWLAALGRHAARLRESLRLARVEVTTLRDDAPKPVRDAATQQLRSLVTAAGGGDSRVLVAPVLISVGSIQRQIVERLSGVECSVVSSGLADSPLAAEWIRQTALRTLALAPRAVDGAHAAASKLQKQSNRR